MTDEPNPQLRERARRALERSLAPVAPPPDEPSDPELLARIEAALLTLPRRRRDIFLAVRLDGASYAELAEQTGLTIRQVEREVARAIAHIDRCLEQREASRTGLGGSAFGAACCAAEYRASPATAGEAVRTGIAPLG